jgi:diguanylate cyclase (GGDEF)-like protein
MPGSKNSNSEVDDLLPLLRRNIFDSHLEARGSEADRSGLPLSLVIIDLDHFKTVNDDHGHQVGDEVLICVARIIKRSTGTKGTCYRYGGEEICILLPNFSVEEAATLSERIRCEIEAAVVSSKNLKITASFGVAEVPAHARTGADLFTKADQALYEAKDLGRNCVRISGEPRPSAPAPRKIERKQPEPGGVTESQKEHIRIDYFREGVALCPIDGAVLNIRESHQHGKKTPDLFVHCPLCGLMFEVPGPY